MTLEVDQYRLMHKPKDPGKQRSLMMPFIIHQILSLPLLSRPQWVAYVGSKGPVRPVPALLSPIGLAQLRQMLAHAFSLLRKWFIFRR